MSVEAGTFIDVEVDDSIAGDAELAKKLEEVCPVDIFKSGESGVEIVARTSTSACSASSASRPPPTARSSSRSSTTAPS